MNRLAGWEPPPLFLPFRGASVGGRGDPGLKRFKSDNIAGQLYRGELLFVLIRSLRKCESLHLVYFSCELKNRFGGVTSSLPQLKTKPII